MTASKDPSKKKTVKQQEEDLRYQDNSPSQRNWKGIAISLLVIVVVCSLITCSVIVLTPVDQSGANNSRLTVWDLFRPQFIPHQPEAKWISNSEVLYRNRDGHVIKFNFVSNETDIILRNSTFAGFKIAKYSVSPDLKYALFAYDVKQAYRYSYTASYIIYNIHTREVWELNPPEVQNAVLQHAAWGIQGQQLIYIFENNIYYQSDVRSHSLRITSSGEENVIYNGMADWLYEEEILQSSLTHWWSPGGERLAYLTINDSLVSNQFLPQFTGSTYPTGKYYPYPKAGQTNPTVRLTVVNLYGPTHSQDLLPPEPLRSRDHYVTMVQWIAATHLAVRWMNRAQNYSILSVCEVTSGACSTRHEETTEFWLTRQDQKPVFSQDRTRLFLSLPVKQGGQGEYHHIAMFTKKSRSEDSEVRYLTSGNWEVTRILAYDENEHILYFFSTEESPQKRHLYSVSAIGLFPRRCLTCHLNKEECGFFDAEASPNKRHIILKCLGPGAPSVILLSFDNVNSYFILENNSPLRAALNRKNTFKTDVRLIQNDNYEFPLKITYPVDFSESSFYGLLLIIDGTPGSQSVNDEFYLDWDSVLSSEGVIVARLDGRGTGFQGQKVLHQIYRRLGTVEVLDQIAALEYLVELPYIDPTRIAVYGEGYGGYLTLSLLRSTQRDIKCSVAMAPIIDWSLYASAFSERYMGPPSSEDNRYTSASLLHNLDILRSQSLLLVHGTADANVHFQHSAELIQHLIRQGANYTLQIYPDEGHFRSPRSQQHLSSSLIGWFRGCLKGAPSVSPDLGKEEE